MGAFPFCHEGMLTRQAKLFPQLICLSPNQVWVYVVWRREFGFEPLPMPVLISFYSAPPPPGHTTAITLSWDSKLLGIRWLKILKSKILILKFLAAASEIILSTKKLIDYEKLRSLYPHNVQIFWGKKLLLRSFWFQATSFCISPLHKGANSQYILPLKLKNKHCVWSFFWPKSLFLWSII